MAADRHVMKRSHGGDHYTARSESSMLCSGRRQRTEYTKERWPAKSKGPGSKPETDKGASGPRRDKKIDPLLILDEGYESTQKERGPKPNDSRAYTERPTQGGLES